jgi:hypothetical protein
MAPRKTKARFGVIVGFDKKLIDRLTHGLPDEVRKAATAHGLPAAAAVVEKKAKQIAPNGRKTGTRLQWSRDQLIAESPNTGRLQIASKWLQWSRDQLIAERALGGRCVIIAGRETICER